ncbi:MAG TPA: amidohydrolase family protein [Candidatus Brocadiia bacterium]|nr:amidohydrolase family protein [Candidatus Brocadiia bacterium]
MSKRIDRRAFMGATSLALGLGITGCAGSSINPVGESNVSGDRDGENGKTVPRTCVNDVAHEASLSADIRKLVDKTPLMDTHEHLPPEADRIANLDKLDSTPAPDFGMLMCHYTDSDLRVSGMSGDDYKKLIGRNLSPVEKWKLVAPYYERCRHTGYQICVRESVRALYGEDDIREDNCEAISRRLREQVRPGFYRRILREAANIEHAQVNSLSNPVFQEIEPADDLLSYDLWTIGIASGVNRNTLNHCAGAEVTTLKQAHETIDHIFDKYGPRAIAVKDQSAYGRRLNYEDVSDEDAAPIFARYAKGDRSLKPEEMKAVQDNLFRRCLWLAAVHKLPVKLHTGYTAGHGGMDLARVRDNMTDVARLSREFPSTTFVLMHIAYPYQRELIALCKHYPRIYADMCWAWIIDPASSVSFLKEFIMAAPACKLFTFGGDFRPVELIAGHARVARRGIALALTQLVQEGWLAESDAPALVERIMRGNARETFDLDRVLKNQKGT